MYKEMIYKYIFISIIISISIIKKYFILLLLYNFFFLKTYFNRIKKNYVHNLLIIII